jgi:Domain of unknown function (DUF4372)
VSESHWHVGSITRLKEGIIMLQAASRFNQLLQHFPRTEFASLVKAQLAERAAKGFTCWTQFVPMTFCQKQTSIVGLHHPLAVSGPVPWAKFRRAKGGVKAHVLLDHDDYLPSYVLITEAKKSDVRVAQSLELNPGSIVAMDRGYTASGPTAGRGLNACTTLI